MTDLSIYIFFRPKWVRSQDPYALPLVSRVGNWSEPYQTLPLPFG